MPCKCENLCLDPRNPPAPMAETGKSPETPRSASLPCMVENTVRCGLKMEGEDDHPRWYSDLHPCTVAHMYLPACTNTHTKTKADKIPVATLGKHCHYYTGSGHFCCRLTPAWNWTVHNDQGKRGLQGEGVTQ